MQNLRQTIEHRWPWHIRKSEKKTEGQTKIENVDELNKLEKKLINKNRYRIISNSNIDRNTTLNDLPSSVSRKKKGEN